MIDKNNEYVSFEQMIDNCDKKGFYEKASEDVRSSVSKKDFYKNLLIGLREASLISVYEKDENGNLKEIHLKKYKIELELSERIFEGLKILMPKVGLNPNDDIAMKVFIVQQLYCLIENLEAENKEKQKA